MPKKTTGIATGTFARSASPRTTATFSPDRAKQLAGKINFRSLATAQDSIGKARLQQHQIPALMTQVHSASSTRALTLSKAILQRKAQLRTRETQSRALLRWGVGKTQAHRKRRQMVAKAFSQSRMNVFMVHGIAELKRAEARAYMKDYFAAGGDMKSVVEWLQIAGGVLRKHRAKAPGTAGGAVDAVGGFIEDAVDAAGDLIGTVVDAVVSAGKSLASAIAEAVKWTASQIADLVEALIEAGKSVAAILNEAVKKGAAALKKFVEGVIDAGRRVADVLAWAASKAASTIRDVVKAIFAAGKAMVDIVKWAAGQAFSVAKKILKALIDAGKSVAAIMSEVVRRTTAAVRSLVRALIQLGRSVAEIVSAVVLKTFAQVKKVVDALLRAGKRLADIVQSAARRVIAAASEVAAAMRTFLKNVVNSLIGLGKTVAQVMASIARRGVAYVRAVAQALAEAGKSLLEIVKSIATRTLSVIKAAVQGLIKAAKSVARIMVAAVRLAASTLKKVVQALYQLGKKVGEILATIVRRTASIIRTVLEGLLAIGVGLVKTVAAICKDIRAGFRKGFFEGLLAIGKGALDLLKAAVKSGLAVLALAFAVLMEMWGGHRGLTRQETIEARRVFGWSIDLSRVKVAVASIPADIVNWLNKQRPFTTMYVINFKSGITIDMATMIHELTHVWQAVVAGPVYMVEALHSQFFGRGYEVTDADIAAANGDINKLEREQQAVVVERYWLGRWGGDANIDSQKYEPLARDVYKPKPTRPIRWHNMIPVLATARLVRPITLKAQLAKAAAG